MAGMYAPGDSLLGHKPLHMWRLGLTEASTSRFWGR